MSYFGVLGIDRLVHMRANYRFSIVVVRFPTAIRNSMMNAASRRLQSLATCARHINSLSLSRISCLSSHQFHRWQAADLSTRNYSAEAIPSPHAEGTEKNYPEKIKRIVDDISHLTLIEVADLNDLLKKTLNISEAPVMAMGAMPAASAQEDDEVEEKAPEKTSFDVKLVKFDEKKKVALIKQMKSIVEGMNLVQAKKFVESAPQKVKSDIPKDEAEKLKEALEAAGATVEIL